MTVTGIAPAPAGTDVDSDELVCPGCAETVVCAPPSGWPERAGARPGFSHRDGSVLCPDDRGRVPEPIEVAALRFDLTGAGAHVLDEAEREQQ